MSTISFTSYVDVEPAEVESRLSRTADNAPEGAVVTVEPLVDRSQIVVTLPWNDTSDAERSNSTLRATRFTRAIERMAYGN